ncbi:phosphatidate cytidylyltransferase [Dysgonomonas sp. 25]|uniref:phosphatidate cytidylyltransferase n=1 Tax=Dysgonomonas sp. 25 TaxID=2302933 RepID=UPI0013D6C618|nr:phosphatidate cytidylyltransferase [Dysgonomonas sp. 25]NDV69753.1 phosphatidate cytidylyltransferase [Dysgonomonas sp. 25]NDV70185.1 phosphatidate cytidylyltransferase [Dysgonomonas sp. 25]
MKKLPNIVVRILAGIVFVGLLLAGILINEFTFAAIFALLTGLALYEFYGLIEKAANVKVSKWLNIIGGLLLFGGVFWYSNSVTCFRPDLFFYLTPYAIFLLVLFVSELYRKHANPLQSLAYSFLGQLYIALPFALTNKLVLTASFYTSYNYIFLLAILVIIWVNDSFAYLTGMTFGKHRLFERISPKKSWEGFFGGLAFAIGASLVLAYFYPELSTPKWIGFAIVTVVSGTFGDLVESLFKRTLGVKDSGNMIPGHGGILDRFDSTILAIPAIVIYLEVIKIF